jgi:hypothetical protein
VAALLLLLLLLLLLFLLLPLLLVLFVLSQPNCLPAPQHPSCHATASDTPQLLLICLHLNTADITTTPAPAPTGADELRRQFLKGLAALRGGMARQAGGGPNPLMAQQGGEQAAAAPKKKGGKKGGAKKK